MLRPDPYALHMNVARHQRIRKNLDTMDTTHLPQVLQQDLKILRRREVELPIIAAGHHVHRPLGRIEARWTGHGNLQDRPNRTLSFPV